MKGENKKPSGMNLKNQLIRAKDRLNKAKAWVVVTFDGQGAPVFSYNVGELQDKQDIRHQAMHKIANDATKVCVAVMEFREKQVAEYDERVKVEEAKSKRTEELEKVFPESKRYGVVSEAMRGEQPIVAGRTFQQEEVKVAAAA